jgi:tetratricopeptide (TPR) repeat protein
VQRGKIARNVLDHTLQSFIKTFSIARGFGCLFLALFVPLAPALPPQQARPEPATKRTPQKTPPLLLEAQELLRQGRIADAKAKIDEELAANPSSVEAYNLLGIACGNEKNYDQAAAAFQSALKINPQAAEPRNNLGSVYIAQQKFDDAAKEFNRVVRLDPANSNANYGLGLVLLAKGTPALAIPHLLRVHPATLPSRLNLTRAYLQSGRTAEGLKEAAQLSSMDKDEPQLHITLGVLLGEAKQYRAAQLELEKADALQPGNFEIAYRLGQACLANQDYPKAETALNRALKLKPDSTEALLLLGHVFVDEKRPVDALDLLVRAHKLAPENTDVIVLLARVSMSQNFFEDAIPLLESGVKLAPGRADLHAALGESYFMSEKAEKAIEEFKILIQLDPSARSYAFMGLTYRQLGRFEEATKYFEQGLKIDPKDISCLFSLGYIEEHQGKHAAAEKHFEEVLKLNPDFPNALLELADLRIANKQFEEAAKLLRRYVKVSSDPAAGYYKLAMVERSLHQTQAAQRDLSVFQTLSKDVSPHPYTYQNLFDYLNNRSALPAQDRAQLDLQQLIEETTKHPDRPQNLYLLAETYLKLGNRDDALKTIVQLDQISAGDYRTQTGVGVLLARYRLYDQAITHFQTALQASPDSDDVKFDLADAYFRKGAYPQALEASQSVSAAGQQDDSFLALLGDIYSHLGDTAHAQRIFREAIARNPDRDQYYLSLALVQLRENDLKSAEATLDEGLARTPASGKLLWGLGLVAALEGNTPEAQRHFERAVDLSPEWSGSYSTLGVFYYQTGEIAKAKEVLDRFKGTNASAGMDVNRIEQALSRAPATTVSSVNEPMPTVARQQLLQFALSLADRTL